MPLVLQRPCESSFTGFIIHLKAVAVYLSSLRALRDLKLQSYRPVLYLVDA